LKKLDDGQYDSIVLAMAGMERLGISRTDVFPLSPQEMIPAPGQGALAVQCCEDNLEIRTILNQINHIETQECVRAERLFLHLIGGGCNVSAGCYVWKREGVFHGHAFLFEKSFREVILKDECSASLGRRLASEI